MRHVEDACDRVVEDPTAADASNRSAVVAALRARRQALGLTLAEMARRMGVTPPTVARFEQERGWATVVVLQGYARAVGLSAEIHLTGAGSPPGPSPN